MGQCAELVDKWKYAFSYVRPHQSLGCLTPMEFLAKRIKESEDRMYVSTMW
jgi:transposase InsO family protein